MLAKSINISRAKNESLLRTFVRALHRTYERSKEKQFHGVYISQVHKLFIFFITRLLFQEYLDRKWENVGDAFRYGFAKYLQSGHLILKSNPFVLPCNGVGQYEACPVFESEKWYQPAFDASHSSKLIPAPAIIQEVSLLEDSTAYQRSEIIFNSKKTSVSDLLKPVMHHIVKQVSFIHEVEAKKWIYYGEILQKLPYFYHANSTTMSGKDISLLQICIASEDEQSSLFDYLIDNFGVDAQLQELLTALEKNLVPSLE